MVIPACKVMVNGATGLAFSPVAGQTQAKSMKMPKFLLLLAITLSLLIASAFAQDNNSGGLAIFGDSPPLLSPEEAYTGKLAVNPDGLGLTLSFTIEEGYYLYKDRFSIVPEGAVVLDDPDWPKAIIYTDQFFGDSEIYRTQFSAPIAVKSATSDDAVVNVTFQGCADIGVCFPPVTLAFPVSGLAIPIGGAALASNQSVLEQLKSLSSKSPSSDTRADIAFASNESEILPPSEAYRPVVETTKNGLSIDWKIEPGYYLYRDKLNYSLTDHAGAEQTFDRVIPAKGKAHYDEFFGDTEILRFGAQDKIDMAPGTNGTGQLTLYYQGCADLGVCFPPEQLQLPVTWNVDAGATGTDSGDSSAVMTAVNSGSGAGASASSANSTVMMSEQDMLATQLATSSLWFNAGAFFIFGILLAFTPCVLPMIPILSSLILGGGEKQTTGQAFWLSITYVMGMALTYTIVGVLVGLSGYNIQAWFQNPWILSTFALLFVAFSLAMFGVYELQLPSGMQNRLSQLCNRQSGGRTGGVFVMGVLSALIVGPCVTAPLMGALIYIADTGDAAVGGTALFALSIGMGVPLILIGCSAGKWVPKAGGWMLAVRVIFGFLMLGMAIWMLSRFLDPVYVALLSAALALCAGIWVIFEYSKSSNTMALRTMGTAIGTTICVYGLTLLIAFLAGNTPSLIKPLSGLAVAGGTTQAGTVASAHLDFVRIKSLNDLNATVSTARAEGKEVMLDFYADWCVSCKEMEAFTFTDPAVQDRLANVVLIQADVTKNDKEDKELLKHFGLFGPPAIIFYDRSGEELKHARLVGFLNAEKFTGHLDTVLVGSSTTRSAGLY